MMSLYGAQVNVRPSWNWRYVDIEFGGDLDGFSELENAADGKIAIVSRFEHSAKSADRG